MLLAPSYIASGEAHMMEGIYGVYFGSDQSGKVQVIRQGLYYRFICRCRLSGKIMCRLILRCGGKEEKLGLLVPMEGGFGLETRIPVKRFAPGKPEFFLRPRHEKPEGNFAPIYPEEPFAYISRLKDAYLAVKNGQTGVVFRESP